MVSVIGILAGPIHVSAEKVQTNLTIGIEPENPTINESFYVTGLLTKADGKPLGNKRVTLESSLKGENDLDGFSFVGIRVTDRKGKYEFYRPIDSPPEFLRVVFSGNTEFEPVKSSVIAVRDAGTDHPQVRSNETGSIMVSTSPQGADIYIDGVLRGVTPSGVADLSIGSHTLKVAIKGYQNDTMEAYVTPDDEVSFDITLT